MIQIAELIGVAAVALILFLNQKKTIITDRMKQNIHTAAHQAIDELKGETFKALRDGRLSVQERKDLFWIARTKALDLSKDQGIKIFKHITGPVFESLLTSAIAKKSKDL